MRIASLLASATEAVYGLGLGDQLVAISHECDYPPDALVHPRISRRRFDSDGLESGAIDAAVRDAMVRHGSVYELDEVQLRVVNPDLILSQAVCDVCAVPTSLAERAAAVLDNRPKVLSLDSHTIEEILDGIHAIAIAAGAPDRSRQYVAELRRRIDSVRERVAGVSAPRVLALEWLDPPFVPGHWTPEMVEVAGGENVLGETQVPSKQVSWSELIGIDPDVLILMPCGYDLAAARTDAERHADRVASVGGRAIAAGRAFVVNGSAYFNRSGPRMVDGIEILAALLHPERFAEIDLDGRAEVWSPR